MDSISVLGAGSWGTAIAQLLAEKGFEARLWARSPELVDAIAASKENTIYLPGVKLSEKILPHKDMKNALKGVSLVIFAIPSHGLRAIAEKARELIPKGAVLVSATKGIEEETLLTPSSILEDALKGAPYKAVAALSGPTFAREVSAGLPAAAVVASKNAEAAAYAQKAFSTARFRVYTNADVMGVELGGALKNVIAIACGISDGLRLGSNARAALITRGLAEIARLGMKLGADAKTFSGLSGLGDLVLTCTGPLSRNYTLGASLATGMTLDEATKGMRMVAEGVKTSRAAVQLSEKHGTELPVAKAVRSILYESRQPKEVVFELMTRGLKAE